MSIGYNGLPRGCSDDLLPWAREAESPLDVKYLYVCHAEANAILNKNTASVAGCRLYVVLFPCNECTKLLLQAGISEVVYFSDKYHDRCAAHIARAAALAPATIAAPSCPPCSVPMTASRRMLDMASVRYRQHTPRDPAITIAFRE